MTGRMDGWKASQYPLIYVIINEKITNSIRIQPKQKIWKFRIVMLFDMQVVKEPNVTML